MDFGQGIEIGALILVGAVLIAAIVAITVGLLRVAFRRMSGRPGRFDRLFAGMARANLMGWHLQGGGPHPDDANAVPTPPGRRVRRRRRS